MKSKIILYLVRHGESLDNISLGTDYYDDFSNGLTEQGKEQALKLAKSLENEDMFRVYSSDFARAFESAEAVINYKKGDQNKHQLEIEASDEIRELDFRSLRQASYLEKTMHFLSLKTSPLEWAVPDGESVIDVGKRMLHFIESICREILTSDKLETKTSVNVLVVGHSIAIACFFILLSSDHTKLHEIVNWNGMKDLQILGNVEYYKIQVSKYQENIGNAGGDMIEMFPMRIEILEKNVSSHLNADGGENKETDGDLSVDQGRKKLSKYIMSIETGKRFVKSGCYQQ